MGGFKIRLNENGTDLKWGQLKVRPSENGPKKVNKKQAERKSGLTWYLVNDAWKADGHSVVDNKMFRLTDYHRPA